MRVALFKRVETASRCIVKTRVTSRSIVTRRGVVEEDSAGNIGFTGRLCDELRVDDHASKLMGVGRHTLRREGWPEDRDQCAGDVVAERDADGSCALVWHPIT